MVIRWSKRLKAWVWQSSNLREEIRLKEVWVELDDWLLVNVLYRIELSRVIYTFPIGWRQWLDMDCVRLRHVRVQKHADLLIAAD